METEAEVLDTQPEVQEGEAPNAGELTPEEIADLKKRADVSSQNYERAKKAEEEKKRLQEELAIAQTRTLEESDTDVFAELARLRTEVAQITTDKQMEAVLKKYPQLNDKSSEFEEYRKDFPADKLEIAAKAFLTEHDMLTEAPKRKGLEDQRGGTRTPKSSSTMTADDAKRLRTGNFKEYLKQVRSGKVKLD